MFLGLQKTRLFDPLLSFPGTNDQPGDYRASGCSACHVVYANDRSTEHSGAYAAAGNLGQTATSDPTIPRNRVRTSHPPPVHAFDSVQPVHGLPHAPGHEHGRDLFRLHLVGQRNGWRAHVAGPATPSQRRRAEPDSDSQSRGLRRARPVVRPRLSRKDRHAGVQPAAATHAVRRLSQPRLDLPRRLQARPQRQPARRRTTRPSRSTIPTSSERPCT